ncbi:MAG TPA: bifunctional isocitrate dehydrogenase kinase/phosphatase [Cyclobacteriaceae bacterium]|nr:bifunctional isocitrate dehydrogenase kinase/phosphatase [Cyclobacteriaceae bacterium]
MTDQLNAQVVDEIIGGFETYMNSFNNLSNKAPKHFRERAWDAMQKTHLDRLRLYKDRIREVVGGCQEILGEEIGNQNLWRALKMEYSLQIQKRNDLELAETFFNSIIRKAVPGLAVNKDLMFVYENYDRCNINPQEDIFYNYPKEWGLHRMFRKMLEDFDFGIPYLNRNECLNFLVNGVNEVILSRYSPSEETSLQVLKSIFYRNKAAYLIGRTFIGKKWMPFIIPLLHGPRGIYVDTLIFDPNIMSGIFSFTRSYFMAEIKIPSQTIAFLNSVISNKKINELYNAIGFNKHGKTEFYRDFLRHLDSSDDQFTVASGIRGMVMTVFTLPSYNIVFKMVKDHFDPPKSMTRQQVKEKYKLVSLHDRVGRMADTHEFEQFHLPLDRIHPQLLKELKNTVNSLIEINGNTLIIKHVYTERRMTPLNIYLETCTTEEARHAVEEYGNAIIQLAQANIFPGDMMTKNFGVTRQKRIVFYDYDEIEFLADMNFRRKPRAETFEQIYASEPWYEIARNDVFPEDFKRFMIGRDDVREHFFKFHENLFNPDFWIGIQERIRSGELIHAFPYPESIRFRPSEPT